MQVTEVSAEGLKREYKVIVPAAEIEGKIDARIKKLAQTVKMPGFRPGKVPVTLLKKQYGRQVMGEILEQTVKDGQSEAISTNGLRPALPPKVEVTSLPEGGDLEFKLDLEVLPEVPPIDFEALHLTRLIAPVDDDAVDRSLDGLVRMRRHFHAIDEPRPAENGDQVVIDFEGKVDGATFEGGKGEGFTLVLGDARMVPGFETAIEGHAVEAPFSFEVTFPEAYPAENLAGKAATFDVTIKSIAAPHNATLDDAFAKGFGAEGLDDLRSKLRERLAQEYKTTARERMKRSLLDQLADAYPFQVPHGMIDLEFNGIWGQLREEMTRTNKGFDDLGQSEEEAQAEYRGIAERRVRLGLVLSDVGTKNGVQVEPQELQQALIEQARRYPGQERQVIEHFRSNQAALDQLRAPIFEDKVVDLIVDKAKVEEKAVSAEELMRDPDEAPDDGAAPAAAKTDDAAAPVGGADDAAAKT